MSWQLSALDSALCGLRYADWHRLGRQRARGPQRVDWREPGLRLSSKEPDYRYADAYRPGKSLDSAHDDVYDSAAGDKRRPGVVKNGGNCEPTGAVANHYLDLFLIGSDKPS